jgi:transposase
MGDIFRLMKTPSKPKQRADGSVSDSNTASTNATEATNNQGPPRPRQRRSIYRQQCPELGELFASAGPLNKVAVVAMDYAKRDHRVIIADGTGEIIEPAFTVRNNADGVLFLQAKVEARIKRCGISPQHVFYGGEDEPTWVGNFLCALQAQGALVLRVNARDAKDLRHNNHASTDDIDVLGIAKCLIIRKARLISATVMQKDESARRVRALRDLMRQRRHLVLTQTAAQNQTHALVDQLCPGFLDAAKSGLVKFGKASLALMSERFSAQELSRRRTKTLAAELRRTGMSLERAEEKALQIQALARTALPAAPAQVPALQRSLESSVALIRSLKRCIDDLEAAMADQLSYLPAAVFTTVPGIGMVLAAALAAELGAHMHTVKFGSQCAYAGIVPRTDQSGGDDSPAVQNAPSRRCNRILKDYLVQAASKQQQYGPPEFKDAFKVMKAEGKHAEFAIARRLLRALRAMHKQHSIYLPPELRAMANKQERTQAQTQALRAYYHQVHEKLCTKWQRGPDWQRFFGEDRILGVILRAQDSLLGLGLQWPQTPAPTKRTARRKDFPPPISADDDDELPQD